MWDVDNKTRYAHAHSWDRDREGADTWIVLIKGTFDILPDGSTRLSSQQLPVCEVPQYNGKPGQSSLRLETDLLRIKPSTDVLVLGHAHAPKARPIDQIDVSLKVAGREKTLRVTGDRIWKPSATGVRRSSAIPFLTMPVVYERTHGGIAPHPASQTPLRWDERNPVGVGYEADAKSLVGRPAANIEYSEGHVGEPAGFGPIPAHWLPRRQWAGTYGPQWEKERKPFLPDDLDDRFFMCSPPDQQPAAHLIGGEDVMVRNMTPDGCLQFRLPRVVLGFETQFDKGAPATHRQVLHSAIIEPDWPRVSLVWQTSLKCHSRVLNLQSTHVFEKLLVTSDSRH